MKLSIVLLSLFLLAISLRAGINVDVVVASEAEIVKRAIPVVCDIDRKDDGSLILKLTLRDLFGVNSEFIDYEVRTLKKPVAIADLKAEFFHLELIARRQRSRENAAVFALKKDEIPNSYLVITSSLGTEKGMAKLRSVCLSLPALAIR